MTVPSIMERLRQLVGSKGWDYCILWKLSQDQRCLEWGDCCCAGVEGTENYGEEHLFLLPRALPCRDVMFQHPISKPCELLALSPSSMPLDGMNADALISNQAKWLNFAKISDETIGTRVSIPAPGGLVELFATKQVLEDQHVINFVVDQCNMSMEEEAMSGSANVDMSCLQSSYLSENGSKNDYLEEANNTFTANQQLNPFKTPLDNGYEGIDSLRKTSTDNNPADVHHPGHVMEFSATPQQREDKGAMKHDMVQGDSDSDQFDEEDDPKYRRRSGKGQSKNLEAERKRRKKLNERLYNLRSLVPKISKMDKASILRDAIDYVKELQQQVKDLQNQLEQNSEDEGTESNLTNIQMDFSFGVKLADELVSSPHGFYMGAPSKSGSDTLKRSHDSDSGSDKGQQMEVQVEVSQLEGNEVYIKVFGEQRRGGFVRLMEAVSSLGLEITNVTVTSCISLVSYVFVVERRDGDAMQVEYLRESLLEASRNQSRRWMKMTKVLDDGVEADHNQYNSHLHNHQFGAHQHHFHNFQ